MSGVSPPQNLAQRQSIEKCSRLYVKETYFLILKHWPEGQALRGLLGYSLRMETGRCHLCAVPLPPSLSISLSLSLSPSLSSLLTLILSRHLRRKVLSMCISSATLQIANISQRQACTRVWCPGFCGCCPGTPLDHLSLVARRAWVPGTETPEKQFLDNHHSHDTTQIADWNTFSVTLWKRPIDLTWTSTLSRLRVWHTFRGPLVCSLGKQTSRCHLRALPLPHSTSLVYLGEKKNCTLIWCSDFCNCHHGDTSRLFALVARKS